MQFSQEIIVSKFHSLVTFLQEGLISFLQLDEYKIAP